MKFKENYRIRKPTGPNIVGVKRFFYEYKCGNTYEKKRVIPTQEERRVMPPQEEKRVIPCLCFYPARNKGEGNLKKYINEKILPGTETIKTNSYIDAPIANGKHPLILFNHGFALNLESNTVQFEELASHGYVILSVGHIGDGSYELENGGVLEFDMVSMMDKFQEEARIATEMWPKYQSWLIGKGKNRNIREHKNYYNKIIKIQPMLTSQTNIWIEDSIVAIDKILNDNHFSKYIDKSNIGALGMSFGGSVSLSLANNSDLVKVAVNLDGFFYSQKWNEPISKPIMLMHHDQIGGHYLTFPFLNAENDAYLITIKNTTHGNFADYNEILAENEYSKGIINGKEVEAGILGEVDPHEMETILNKLLIDFFNKYLKGKDFQIIDTGNLSDNIDLIIK